MTYNNNLPDKVNEGIDNLPDDIREEIRAAASRMRKDYPLLYQHEQQDKEDWQCSAIGNNPR